MYTTKLRSNIYSKLLFMNRFQHAFIKNNKIYGLCIFSAENLHVFTTLEHLYCTGHVLSLVLGLAAIL